MTNGLAQALNGNFASLTKSGFVLDEHTKSLIKNGTEAEKAEAIQRVLAGTYGGFATEAMDTAIGRQIMLNKSLEDVQKTVASAVIPIIDELKIRLLDVVQVVLEWTEQHPELTKNIIIATTAILAIGSSLLVIIPII
jgi:anthranilate phosphoribosyltransferase